MQKVFTFLQASYFILFGIHYIFATMSSDELKKQVTIKEIYLS